MGGCAARKLFVLACLSVLVLHSALGATTASDLNFDPVKVHAAGVSMLLIQI
jgi:hypothetical protein